MNLQILVVLLVGVSLSSCVELAKVNKTSSTSTVQRKFQREWYGSSYKPKGWDPKLHTSTRSDTHYGYEPPEGKYNRTDISEIAKTWEEAVPKLRGLFASD